MAHGLRGAPLTLRRLPLASPRPPGPRTPASPSSPPCDPVVARSGPPGKQARRRALPTAPAVARWGRGRKGPGGGIGRRGPCPGASGVDEGEPPGTGKLSERAPSPGWQAGLGGREAGALPPGACPSSGPGSSPPCPPAAGPQASSDSAMGDSDDEYDRRRRDKFRRERSDYDRSRERDERRRGDDWNDR